MNLDANGNNNSISIQDIKVDGLTVVINGHGNSIEIEPDCFFPKLRIEINGNGNRIRFGRDCRWNDGHIKLQGDNISTVISEKTTVGRAYVEQLEGCDLTIGKDCMLSHEITFRLGDPVVIKSANDDKILNPRNKTVIGDHVWIGRTVTVTAGANIADGSIVALESIVTRPCEVPNSVISGFPARAVKTGVVWDRQKIEKLPR